MKTCSRCHTELPLTEFYKRTAGGDGYQSHCRWCGVGSRYGLSRIDMLEMWHHQGDGCAICHDPCEDRPPHVDHDHNTGEPRGLLCRSCNIGLGNYFDDPELLRAAAEYVEGAA